MTSPDAPFTDTMAVALQRHVGHLLRRAYGIARANSAISLADLGDVSPVQASVLASLGEAPLTQADLGRRIGMEPANTHALVRRMITAGWLEMLTPGHPQRRGKHVALTASGRAVMDRLGPAFAQSADRTLAPLSADERLLLIDMLRQIIAADTEAVRQGDASDA